MHQLPETCKIHTAGVVSGEAGNGNPSASAIVLTGTDSVVRTADHSPSASTSASVPALLLSCPGAAEQTSQLHLPTARPRAHAPASSPRPSPRGPGCRWPASLREPPGCREQAKPALTSLRALQAGLQTGRSCCGNWGLSVENGKKGARWLHAAGLAA